MKKVFFAVAALVFQAVSLVAQETSASSPSADGLTKGDVQVLKDAVLALQDSFQSPVATQSPNTTLAPTSAPAPVQKSMAEVADKVVDLGARAIAQAAGTVQKVAPEVWRIMIRQQYAKAAGLLVVPSGMFLLCLFAWFKTEPLRFSFKNDPSKEEDGYYAFFGYVVPLFFMGAFGLWFLNRLSSSVLFLFNPEYYAFRDLLVMILNKGQEI
jgi:hypothetical protein